MASRRKRVIERLAIHGFGVEHFPKYVQRGSWRHAHDGVEMLYVAAGTCVHILGDQRIEAGPGTLAIVHYDQEHDIRTGPEGIEAINCYIDLASQPLPDLGEELGADLRRVLPMHPSLRHRRNRFVSLQCVPGGDEERLLRLMLVEQGARRLGWTQAMHAALRLFLIALARRARDQAPAALPSDRASDLRMERVRRILDEEFREAFALGSLARRARLTRSHLCRAFKRYVGATPLDYVHGQRLDAAMAALRDSRDPIAEVALSCGFGDISFFNRKFRAVAGITPTAYRRRFTAQE